MEFLEIDAKTIFFVQKIKKVKAKNIKIAHTAIMFFIYIDDGEIFFEIYYEVTAMIFDKKIVFRNEKNTKNFDTPKK